MAVCPFVQPDSLRYEYKKWAVIATAQHYYYTTIGGNRP